MSDDKAPPDWWREFFSGLAVEFWQAALPEEATRADVEFLWRELHLSEDARVLDVACGAGRLALPLAERGCAMSGVDISDEFLHAAGRAGAERGLPLDLRRADMRALPWESTFDAVFCFGNSFGFLDDAGHTAFLGAVARALVPGGRFALDYGQAAESVLPRLVPHEEAQYGDFRFIEDNRYDPLTGRVETRYTFERGSRKETKLGSHRVYTANEVVRMLGRAGLIVLDLFGSPDGAPYQIGSPRLILVAERAGGSSQGTRG
ncbi:MAG: methyltransferase domain-containing protein [Thermoanaerobaculia bacterium]